jgi:hypothetical protein
MERKQADCKHRVQGGAEPLSTSRDPNPKSKQSQKYRSFMPQTIYWTLRLMFLTSLRFDA